SVGGGTSLLRKFRHHQIHSPISALFLSQPASRVLRIDPAVFETASGMENIRETVSDRRRKAGWRRLKLSIVIPAHNEGDAIAETVRDLHRTLSTETIIHEIVVVNDNSGDHTQAILDDLQKEMPALRILFNPGPNGFGLAVRKG